MLYLVGLLEKRQGHKLHVPSVDKWIKMWYIYKIGHFLFASLYLVICYINRKDMYLDLLMFSKMFDNINDSKSSLSVHGFYLQRL